MKELLKVLDWCIGTSESFKEFKEKWYVESRKLFEGDRVEI
jgi:hypothetical protein